LGGKESRERSGEKAERDREGESREISGGDWRKREEKERSGERDSLHVLGDEESPLGDDTG